MQVNGILGHAGAIVIIVVGLLSGVLSVIREFQVMYIPARAGDKRTFWAWVRIAFVVAAVLLWWDEHTKVIQLSKPKEIVEVNVAQRPWLAVSGAKISSKDSLNLAGIMIHVKNTGSVPATPVAEDCACDCQSISSFTQRCTWLAQTHAVHASLVHRTFLTTVFSARASSTCRCGLIILHPSSRR